MRAYIINMPDAKERRIHIEHLFKKLTLIPVFIEACIGKELRLPDQRYNEQAYRRAHGKITNLAELGCYFSHLNALAVFLKTKDEFAVILEDDVSFEVTIESLLKLALKHHSRFDLLRLSGSHKGTPIKILKLNDSYNLCCNYTRQTGAGAYLLNRHAASKILENLSPMWLPYDHAFDREWLWGVKSMCIDPIPIKQNNDFESQINAFQSYKLPFLKRYITVFPYRAWNETCRFLFRSMQIIKNKIQNKLMKPTTGKFVRW
jgi:glycosyl transferase family 25